jgi:hypothetical protein
MLKLYCSLGGVRTEMTITPFLQTDEDETLLNSEYEAFDRLGPATRYVLQHAIFPLPSWWVLATARRHRLHPLHNDRAIAEFVKAELSLRFGVPFEDAVIKKRALKGGRS